LNEILHPNAILSDQKCQRIRELPFGLLKETAELSTEIESLQALVRSTNSHKNAIV
jgi:hypothetical protein